MLTGEKRLVLLKVLVHADANSAAASGPNFLVKRGPTLVASSVGRELAKREGNSQRRGTKAQGH